MSTPPGDAVGPIYTQTGHFKPLDGLRGIAVLLVVIMHSFWYKGHSLVGRILDPFAGAGWTGVTLFFVLSGFLITGILLDTRGRSHYLRDFYARRSLRIAPLYFVFLAIYFFALPALAPISDALNQPEAGSRIFYWLYLTNMMEWLTGKNNVPNPLAPLWSLAVEEQVYLFWPFLIMLVPQRRLAAVFMGLAFASAAWRLWNRANAQPIALSYLWMPGNLEAFAAGAMVAWLSREDIGRLARHAPGVALGSGLFIAGMFAGQRHFRFWLAPVQMLTIGTTAVIFFFAAIIGYSTTTGERAVLNRILSASWLRSVGKYSYAIYVLHATFVVLLQPIIFSGRTGYVRHDSVIGEVVFTVSVVSLSYVAAWISWRAIESPFLRLKTYFPLSGTVVRPADGVPLG